tara:strand:+ start:6304 stop:6765 length:462 start_codon:yes stop_codon:yes gene_type:complete
MAVAVTGRRVAYVLFRGRRPLRWDCSEKAVRSPKAAESFVRLQIANHDPDIVVSEDAATNPHKGPRVKRLLRKVAQTISDEPVTGLQLKKRRLHANKYLTARSLSERFPEMGDFLPKSRKFYEREHARVAFIEALILALEVIDGSQSKNIRST